MIKFIFKFLIDPFAVFGLLFFLALIAWCLGKKRLFKWLILTSGICFLVISIPLLPTLLLNSLEDQYVPLSINEIPDRSAEYHILILGGGHGFDSRLPANSLLSKRALGRLAEGIRLHRHLPNSKLVLSGFSASGGTTQAEMLQQAALLLGVDKQSTILQKEPGNTYEEAKAYAAAYGSSHPVILVTGAFHMPRSVKMFTYFGIDLIASPTNYRLKGSWKQKWLGWPSTKNIENLSLGISEYASILWYRLLLK